MFNTRNLDMQSMSAETLCIGNIWGILKIKFLIIYLFYLFILNQLRWLNTVFACAFADAIQHAHKD